jgi:glycosyltransferase involved in cell wall biosynthesis
MHILYFHQYFATPAGKTGTRSYEFARALVNKGHKVSMVCVSQGEDLGLETGMNGFAKTGKVDGIDVIQFNLKYSNHQSLVQRARVFLCYALFSIYLALTMSYDLVFATSTPLTASIPGIFAKLLRRKPFVFEVRDLWPELPKAMGVVTNPLVLAGMSFLELFSYRAASACVGLSPGICEGIARRSPSGRKITMIPNGCDLDMFVPGKRESLKLSGIQNNDCVAVFTGAHGMANGLHAVLDAAAVIKKRGRSDIKLVFIGDGKLKPELVQRAKIEELTNCLFFEPMPKKDLSKVVSCADVGLMILDNVPAFYYGTSPNKFFDYIASGLPVLNNYPGWLADMINEHNCGVAVPPGDSEAFADALCYMADHPEKRPEMSINARKLAEAKFDRNKLAAKFTNFLEAVYEKNESRKAR